MNFFKSIFTSSETSPEEAKKKEENKNFDIFKYDGMRAQNMGKLDYAVKCYQEALDIRKDEEVMAHLGQALAIQGKTEEAFDAYQALVKAFPNTQSSFLALANICFLLDKYDEMLDATTRAIEIDEKNAAAHYLQGRAQHGLKNDIMAIANLTKAITLKEDYTEALLLRAEILIEMKQTGDAEKDLDVVLAQNPSDEDGLRLKGKLMESLGKTDEAEKLYRDLIETDPFYEQAYISLGEMLIGQNKLQDAISLLNDAIELNPKFAEAYRERGKARLLNGDKDGSVEDGKKALELKPQEADISGQFKSEDNKPINILGI